MLTLAALAVILVTFGQALLMTGLLVALPVMRSISNICLAGAVLALAISGLADAASAIDTGMLSLRLIAIGIAGEAVATPLLFLHLLLLEEGKQSRQLWQHAAAPVALLVLLAPAVVLPSDAWSSVVAAAPPSQGMALAALMTAVAAVACPLLQAFYLLSAVFRWGMPKAKNRLHEQRADWAGNLILWLSLLWMVSLAARILGLLGVLDERLAPLVDLLFGLALNGMIWAGLARRGTLMRAAASIRNTVEEAVEKYRRSSLTEDRAAEIIAKARSALVDRRFFADPALTLSRLAKRLGVSPNELSQAINQMAGLRFNDFVNATRVEEAKVLLASPARSSQTILDIAYEVGFNSKSTFNAAFAKMTGSTPSQFRAGAVATEPKAQ